MYLDLPIEQLLRRTDTPFQFGFAAEAIELVPERDEFLLSPSRNGLRILGRNEESLAVPVEVLRDVYGPKLEVQPPRVRLIEGVQVQQPIMHVRISLETPHVALLGLSSELGKLTEGSAKHWIALSHYALVARDPGPRAA